MSGPERLSRKAKPWPERPLSDSEQERETMPARREGAPVRAGSETRTGARGAPQIDAGRLLGRLDELAQIGAIEGTKGNCRLALTDEDRAGRDLVRTWMADLGLEVTIDGLGNVVACTEAGRVADSVMMGSHIDTVATGGRYDGNLGVLAGLEVIESALASGPMPARPLSVAYFTDEEGSRFAPDMLGSLAYAGGLALEEALEITDRDGISVGDELDRIGYRGAAPVPGTPPFAFVELHIEQGPVLEFHRTQIGVVTGVQGISWTEVTLDGQSNHAGTTPMPLRRDAGLAACRIAAEVRDLAHDIGDSQVGTVGSISLAPNLVNVIAGSATMTVDLRNTSEGMLLHAEDRLDEIVERVARSERLGASMRRTARFAPVEFHPAVVGLVEDCAAAAGLSHRRMPSGAGHDAQMLARVCPAAMIFVPSFDGVSHNPAEHTAPEDIEAGANLLAEAVWRLADGEADEAIAGATTAEGADA